MMSFIRFLFEGLAADKDVVDSYFILSDMQNVNVTPEEQVEADIGDSYVKMAGSGATDKFGMVIDE